MLIMNNELLNHSQNYCTYSDEKIISENFQGKLLITCELNLFSDETFNVAVSVRPFLCP